MGKGVFVDRTGETRRMKNGLMATVIRYKNIFDMDAMFENGIIYSGALYDGFKSGNLKCPMIITHKEGYVEVTNANVVPQLTFLMDIEDLSILENYLWVLKDKQQQ